MSGVRKPSPESSVPGENLNRGSRRNQLRRGHGSPPVLGEVPHELSTAAHSKECKRSPQQFIPAGFPLTTTFNRGRKTQPSPSPHRTWSVPDASSQPQLNLHLNRLKRNRCNTDIPLNLRLFLKIHGGAGRPGLPLRQNGSTGCAADNTGCN